LTFLAWIVFHFRKLMYAASVEGARCVESLCPRNWCKQKHTSTCDLRNSSNPVYDKVLYLSLALEYHKIYWLGRWVETGLGFYSRRGLGILIFTTASRTALGPTQSRIQWVQVPLSLGVKQPGREADHFPPSSTEVKERVELYLHSPSTPSWRGAQLKHRDNFTFTFTPIHGQLNPVLISTPYFPNVHIILPYKPTCLT
jgi:hypothetical protein